MLKYDYNNLEILKFLHKEPVSKTEYLNNKTFESIILKFQQSKKQLKKYQFLLEDFDTSVKNLEKKNKTTDLPPVKELLSEAYKNFKQVENDITESFYILSSNVYKYKKFNLDIDDAVQEGVLACFDKIDRFNPVYGKAFSYLTTCIINHMRQMYRSIKSYNDFKKKYHVNFVEQVTDQKLNKYLEEVMRKQLDKFDFYNYDT